MKELFSKKISKEDEKRFEDACKKTIDLFNRLGLADYEASFVIETLYETRPVEIIDLKKETLKGQIADLIREYEDAIELIKLNPLYKPATEPNPTLLGNHFNRRIHFYSGFIKRLKEILGENIGENVCETRK